MSTVCRQCGSERAPRRGRCAGCGALVDVSVVARSDRRRATLEALGDPFDWAGEVAALVVVALAALEVLPTWTLFIAALLVARPVVRLLLRGASGALDGP